MFDVGFSELVLIGIVALLVLGPERLPRVARAVGFWVGRLRRFVENVKTDIDRQIRAEELRRMMDTQAKEAGVHEIVNETQAAITSAQQSVSTLPTPPEEKTAVTDVTPAGTPATPPPAHDKP